MDHRQEGAGGLLGWKPVVLTLDLCMPDKDAIDLFPILEEVKFDGGVVIISGHDEWLRKSASKLASARGINVVGDMPKPLDTAAFRQFLQTLQTSAVSSVWQRLCRPSRLGGANPR